MNSNNRKTFYIESYGCQMNFSDSEIVASIMVKEGYTIVKDWKAADIMFLNTCSIRDKAEQTIRKRLRSFRSGDHGKSHRIIGILGCMAERLKSVLLEEEKIVDIVAGPDSYRDIPILIKDADDGRKAVNVFLSREETYASINPVRLDTNGVNAFISIMRGCDNMCSFCIVPFTRGRERSRDPISIAKEIKDLSEKGYREVTLLGQNVDSYKYNSDGNKSLNFANLLAMVAEISPDMRIRFSTSHPKDITEDVLHTMKKYDNICKHIHLPIQSGNTRILKMMNRTYTREKYLDQVQSIHSILGKDCGISSDIIVGFCSETTEEFEDTVSLMQEVGYDNSYMFYYSERPGTLAARKYKDDVQLQIKKERLTKVIEIQRQLSLESNQKDIGKIFRVLIEDHSKRSLDYWKGRTSANKMVIFPKNKSKRGDYQNVRINDCTSATLKGIAI